jgi:hypothetical protein
MLSPRECVLGPVHMFGCPYYRAHHIVKHLLSLIKYSVSRSSSTLSMWALASSLKISRCLPSPYPCGLYGRVISTKELKAIWAFYVRVQLAHIRTRYDQEGKHQKLAAPSSQTTRAHQTPKALRAIYKIIATKIRNGDFPEGEAGQDQGLPEDYKCPFICFQGNAQGSLPEDNDTED